jgi:hypothetical protein
VRYGELKKTIKEKYWHWKWTFGVNQQQHIEEKRLQMKQLEKNGYKNTILDNIWAKQLVWYRHVQRMDEEI